MCGIAGVVARTTENAVSPALLGAMPRALSLIRHRGPDAQRLACFSKSGGTRSSNILDFQPDIRDACAVLGHARLSIIDLSSAAHQPMRLKRNPSLWMVYNGEIYNYSSLKAELKQQGCEFETGSDSEVVLALYEQLGPGEAFLKKLNGMFALAIWDDQRKQLFLARDRYGVKPLYYTMLSSGELAFASELKSLLALPGCSKTMDAQALHQHLTFQNVLTDQTLVSGVHMLMPGHWGLCDLNQGTLELKQYWVPEFLDQTFSKQKIKAQANELRQLLESSVTSQLVGDVPLGSFLSGGLDTGAISALASRHFKDLQTFTCGFEIDPAMTQDEQYFDERIAARGLASLLHTRHHEMTLASGALPSVLPAVVWHLDDFRAGISYQNYLVSALVKKDVTVVLSGVGGDELFAGYPWRYAPVLNLQDAHAFESAYYQSWVRLLSDDRKRALFSASLNQQLNGYSSRAVFDTVLSSCHAGNPLHKALCFDMRTFLHGLLVVEDRLSMAHSLESRVPFLDNEMVDFCLRLPAESKLQFIDGQPVAKWILKEAMRGILPDEVIHRRKQGFTPPEASWFRTQSRPFVEEVLLGQQSLERGWFEPPVLRSILNEHFEGKQNHRFLIWSLLCFEWWQRLMLDPATPAPPDGIQSEAGYDLSLDAGASR